MVLLALSHSKKPPTKYVKLANDMKMQIQAIVIGAIVIISSSPFESCSID